MQEARPAGVDLTQQPTTIAVRQPRARGEVRAAFDGSSGTTRLTELRQAGSSRALFPRTPSKSLQMVLTNTSGGVTGGDQFRTDVTAGAGSVVTITTQAAERAYRAQPGQVGRVDTRLSVLAGSHLSWLPQETLLFDGCNFSRRLCVNLDTSSSCLVVEPLVFGRTAMGEAVNAGSLEDHLEINLDGQRIFLDRTRLVGDMAEILSRPAVAAGAGASAMVLMVSPAVEGRLDAVRALLPASGGASLVRENLMIARVLAADSFELRKSLVPLIELLHQDVIPRPWMI